MEKHIIKTQLTRKKEKIKCRLHMPGHKGIASDRTMVWEQFDWTEVPGTDNLHNPEEMIKEAQEKISEIYGADHSFILVNGSTVGIQTAMIATSNPGDTWLVARNVHRSVYAGLVLGGLNYISLPVVIDREINAGVAVDTEVLKQLLDKYPEVKGFILPNLTYYGTCSDIKTMAQLLHSRDKLFLVDEAHGSHLKFSENYPVDALTAGADLVIQSTHKTLSSFTQSSLLHCQGSRVNPARLQETLAMLESSSPSYPLIMSVENAVDEAVDHGEENFNIITRFYHTAKQTRELKTKDDMVTFYNPTNNPQIADIDPSKWVFKVKGGLGLEIEKQLRENYSLQLELATPDVLIAMGGINSTQGDFYYLLSVLPSICAGFSLPGKKTTETKSFSEVPLQQASLRDTFYAEKTWCKLDHAEGKVCGNMIIPYPPGIPVLLPGEIISRKIIDEITWCIEQDLTVLGIEEKRIQVTENMEIE
jgi:arginine/lysine/ornithine decarboxylase